MFWAAFPCAESTHFLFVNLLLHSWPDASKSFLMNQNNISRKAFAGATRQPTLQRLASHQPCATQGCRTGCCPGVGGTRMQMLTIRACQSPPAAAPGCLERPHI